MTEQPRLFEPFEGDLPHVESLARGAEAYTRQRGLDYTLSREQLAGVRQDPNVTMLVGKAYKQNMGGHTDTQALRHSYATLARETGEQFDYLTRPREKGGLGVNVQVVPHDPYPGPDELREDVAKNNRLQVFSTASTGKHEFFDDDTNDKFRAVHDAFGHLAIGRDFGRHGEEAAARHHAQMFSPEAHAALFSETRGQNSFVHAGAEFPNPGPFPSQDNHLVSIPDWATKQTPEIPLQPKQHERVEQGRLF